MTNSTEMEESGQRLQMAQGGSPKGMMTRVTAPVRSQKTRPGAGPVSHLHRGQRRGSCGEDRPHPRETPGPQPTPSPPCTPGPPASSPLKLVLHPDQGPWGGGAERGTGPGGRNCLPNQQTPTRMLKTNFRHKRRLGGGGGGGLLPANTRHPGSTSSWSRVNEHLLVLADTVLGAGPGWPTG